MEVPSVGEGLRLVSEGKLFGYIDIVPSISQALAKGNFSDLKIAGRLDAHVDLAVASRDDEPELQSLFQKAVNSLGPEESDAIIKKWLAVTFEQGFDYALLWKVLAGVAVVLALVVWWNRKLTRLNRTIRRAHEELDQTNRRMAALLDNAGQGFLTVGANGVVEPQYSQECRSIFGVDIAGASLPQALYPDDATAREAMAKNIRRVLGEPDGYRRELYLSLMPKSVDRGEVALRLAYRLLTGERLMFVITDVSGEKRLRDAVAREHARLACVVAAVRDERDFFEVLDAFATFRRQGAGTPPDTTGERELLDLVYRQVHTFKGLFLQLECAQVAGALETVEERLAELRRTDLPEAGAVAAILADTAVDRALEQDLDVVRQTLGEAFFARRGQVTIDGRLLDALAGVAGRLLARAPANGLTPEDADVLRATTTARHVDLKALLGSYPRTALRLAQAQGKVLAPFAVEGDLVLVDPRRFGPLAKSLVHAIRNAVDHGLESPQEREQIGKTETGHMLCRVVAGERAARIEIADDGRGVDLVAVRARAFELGLGGAEALAALDDVRTLELLFYDGFTTRRTAGAISGRGVGLAAVRAEAERLGGGVVLETTPGQGTRLMVTIPLEPSATPSEAA